MDDINDYTVLILKYIEKIFFRGLHATLKYSLVLVVKHVQGLECHLKTLGYVHVSF